MSESGILAAMTTWVPSIITHFLASEADYLLPELITCQLMQWTEGDSSTMPQTSDNRGSIPQNLIPALPRSVLRVQHLRSTDCNLGHKQLRRPDQSVLPEIIISNF